MYSLETIYERSINNLGRNKFLSKPNQQMMSKIGNTILDAGEVTRGSELQPLLLEEPLIIPTGGTLRSEGLNKPLQPQGPGLHTTQRTPVLADI